MESEEPRAQEGSTPVDPWIDRSIGPYTIRRLLGTGGMGRVYEAEHAALGRSVALKLLHAHLRMDPTLIQRFYTEARAASRLNHPNSVAVLNFGVTDDQTPYLVMERLRGTDLRDLLDGEGPMAADRVCRLALQALGALAEAHALGIVHRDVKPENILVVPQRDGSELVKVVDFGLAQLADLQKSRRFTEPGMCLGTPAYMAPEQFSGELLDGRGDLYSLAVVLFELLAGRPPFEDESPMVLARKHWLEDPVDVRRAAPQRAIPGELAEVVARALKKRPEHRFQTADEMAVAIRRVGLSAPPQRSVRRPAASGASSAAAPTGDPSELALLERCRGEAALGPVIVRVTGESGVGKTTLLNALAERARRDGDRVARAGAHPLRAPVGYWPLRELASSLLHEPASEWSTARDAASAVTLPGGPTLGSLERAGLSELLLPVGLRGLDGESRCGAVSAALAAAVRGASAGGQGRRVALLLDDADRYDALTVEALRRLLDDLRDLPLLVVLVTDDDTSPAARIEVRGCPIRTARMERERSPLHAELLRAVGWTPAAGEDAPRPAEAVGALLERLGLQSRRVVQALAVLGDAAPRAAIEALVGAVPDEALEALRSRALLLPGSGATVEMHPLVRDVVEASVPVEVRRELHDRALAWHEDLGAPLEVRAEHALRGGDAETALLLLEQVGQAAIGRGDPVAATQAFGRALGRARAELARTGDEAYGRAVLSFTRRLADALRRAGRLSEAEGALREVEDEIGLDDNRQRAQMRIAGAHIAAARGRLDHARAEATLALGVLAQRGADPAELAEVELFIAELALATEPPAEVELDRAAARVSACEGPPERRAAMAVRLAALRAQAGDRDRAASSAHAALDLARAARAAALEAVALGMIAEHHAALGSREGNSSAPPRRTDAGGAPPPAHRSGSRSLELSDRAAREYRDAARLAGDAGDLARHHRFSEAADALGARRQPSSRRPPPSTAPPNGRAVLLVEDDPATQEALGQTLEDEGYRVHCAGNGRQALRLLSHIERPCAILVDLMMPIMNGWDLLEALRGDQAYATIPVVIISAVADRGPRGARRIKKPVDLGVLLEVVGEISAGGSQAVPA